MNVRALPPPASKVAVKKLHFKCFFGAIIFLLLCFIPLLLVWKSNDRRQVLFNAA